MGLCSSGLLVVRWFVAFLITRLVGGLILIVWCCGWFVHGLCCCLLFCCWFWVLVRGLVTGFILVFVYCYFWCFEFTYWLLLLGLIVSVWLWMVTWVVCLMFWVLLLVNRWCL